MSDATMDELIYGMSVICISGEFKYELRVKKYRITKDYIDMTVTATNNGKHAATFPVLSMLAVSVTQLSLKMLMEFDMILSNIPEIMAAKEITETLEALDGDETDREVTAEADAKKFSEN